MARKTRKAPLLAPDKAEVEKESGYRAGLYLRLSVESTEAFDGNSLGHQREICLDYLRDKPEIQVWETYIDNGFSGTNFDRKAFQQMVSDLQAGSINCVVVKDLSRFGRNYLDVDEYLNEKFPAWGVRFISVLERFDTAAPSRESGFIVPFRNILNDYYARDISQKRKSAIRARMEAGEYLPPDNLIPYGYTADREHFTYRIDPETAPVVRRIFQMRLAGKTTGMIARTLNQEGISSPMRYRYLIGIVQNKTFDGQMWEHAHVATILKNEAYLGIRVHRKTDSFLGKTRITTPDEQIRIEGAHPPLIEQGVFEKIQAMRQTQQVLPRKSRPPVRMDIREGLTGRIFCGDCGSLICMKDHHSTSDHTTYYARCSLFKKNPSACTAHSISLEKLAMLLQAELNRHTDLLMNRNKTIQQRIKCTTDEQCRMKRQLQSIRVRKRNLKSKKDVLLLDYMNGRLTKNQFAACKERLIADSESLSAQEAVVLDFISSAQHNVSEARRWTAAVQEYQKERKITNALLRETVERVDLFQHEKRVTVQITFRYRDVYQHSEDDVGGEAREADQKMF